MSETRQLILFMLCAIAAGCSFYSMIDGSITRYAVQSHIEGK